MAKLTFKKRYKFRLTKSKSIQLLFIILIIIIISLYIIKTKSKSDSIVFIISNNQFVIITSQNQTIRCIVYVQERAGRLGNRMFITASAYSLARLHSCHLYLTPEIIKELTTVFVFNLSSLLISTSTFKLISNNIIKPLNRINKGIGCQYLPELIRPNAISQGTIFQVIGFWQSYLHFDKYRDELREHIFAATQPILVKISKWFIKVYQQKLGFTPRFSLENHQSFKNQLAESGSITWIGMHVRRVDFVGLNYSSSDEYLFTAIKYYTSLYSNAHFIVATDDKPYCKNLFRNQSNIFVTPLSFTAGVDLLTLSLCQHSIMTSGTFGWWAAYLANGKTVHDTVYPTRCEKDEYYYPPWFKTNIDIINNKEKIS